MKSFSNETLNFFLQKVLRFLHFGSCKNFMSSVNLVAEIYWKAWNKRALNKVSSRFLRQDSLSSYSLVRSKMQEAQNFLKKKIYCFIGERFHIWFSHTHKHTYTHSHTHTHTHTDTHTHKNIYLYIYIYTYIYIYIYYM